MNEKLEMKSSCKVVHESRTESSQLELQQEFECRGLCLFVPPGQAQPAGLITVLTAMLAF